MKLLIIMVLVVLTGCSAARYQHNDGKNITTVSVDAGAKAQVTQGDATITLDATGSMQ
jgi:uncharacterized protein YceK|nr:MAG TPA: TRAF PROTEIN, TRAO PROTEIN, TRAN ADHESION, BACTERIAL SECRETION.5A [Caudoviricetes sp.]